MSGPDLISPAEAHLNHRITFGTARTLAYVSVLELGKIWERTLRRAGVPVKYSQGYTPRPRMAFAAPLPVGCGSENDLLDVELDEAWSADAIRVALRGVTPQDLTVVNVDPIPADTPSLAEQLQATVYRVGVRNVDHATVDQAVEQFLDAEVVPLPKRGRKHRGKTYDLRPLVHALELAPRAATPSTDLSGEDGKVSHGWQWLRMRLNAEPGATGRPDEVLKALGFADLPRRCTRVRMILGNG